jgi:hypothetical protein
MENVTRLEKPDEKRSYHLVLHDPSFDPKDTKPISLMCLAGFEDLTEHKPTIRLQIWRSFLRHFTEALSGDNPEEIIEALWPWHYAPLLDSFQEFLWLDGRFHGAVFYLVPTSSEYDPKKDLKASGAGQLYHVAAAPRETIQIKTRPYDQLLPLFSAHARVDTQGLFLFPNPFAQILSGEIDKTTFSRALKCLHPDNEAFKAELEKLKGKPIEIYNLKQGKRHRGKTYPAHVKVMEIPPPPDNAISGANKAELAANIAKEIGNGFAWTYYALVRKAIDVLKNRSIKILITVPQTRRWYLLKDHLPICAERLPRGNPKIKSPKKN